MNRIALIWIGFLIFLTISSVKAQESEEAINLVYQSTMIGLGNAHIYDTYLSPLEYKGWNLGVAHEQMKMTGIANDKVSAQHFFAIEFANTQNPAHNAHNYSLNLEYAYGLHYRFQPMPKFQIFAGSQINAAIGGIFNSRNGNNPVAGKANLSLNLSGIAAYQFEIGTQTVQLRYQLNIPFIGVMFAPNYGQSYYEIGLGNDDVVHFSSFHNYLSMRNIFSAELPFKACTLRLTYMNRIYETKVNQLDTHLSSDSFYIGLSKNFYTVSGKKQKSNRYRNVFE